MDSFFLPFLSWQKDFTGEISFLLLGQISGNLLFLLKENSSFSISELCLPVSLILNICSEQTGGVPLPGSTHGRWDARRHQARQEAQPPAAFRACSCVRNSSCCHADIGGPASGPRPQIGCHPISKGPVCRVRGSCSCLIWDQSLKPSVPLMSGSALIGKKVCLYLSLLPLSFVLTDAFSGFRHQ